MAEIFSVSGGKFHRSGETGKKPWTPTKTACGLTVTPLNYFETVTSASEYTGNRLSRFGCKKCGLDKETDR